MPRRPLPLIAFTLASLTFTPIGRAQISDDFSAGHGVATGGAYSGEAGNGWSTPWLPKRLNSSIAVDRDILDSEPLVPTSGYYLVVSGLPSNSGIWGIARQFAPYPDRELSGVRRDRSHVISFHFRVDELTGWSQGDAFTIGESMSIQDKQGLGPQSSFFIRAHFNKVGSVAAGTWALYNGVRDGSSDINRFIDSGIPLVTGITYKFSIHLRPDTRSWMATIEDGTRRFTSELLGYRTGGLGTGVLAFFREGVSVTDSTTFSLDSLLSRDGE